MERNNASYYSEITSFEDLQLERTRLILKGRLIETRINLNLTGIRETFSFSGIILTLAKDFFFSRIGDIFGIFTRKYDKEA